MSRRSILAATALLGAALTLSACQSVDQDAIAAEALACPEGSDCFDPVQPIGPGGTLTVTAGEFFFELEQGVAIDGPVTVELINEGSALHNFRIDQAVSDDKKVEADAGETATGELLLFGGTEYTYYCDIPGHRSQGMEGTLQVYLDEEAAAEADAAGETETGTDSTDSDANAEGEDETADGAGADGADDGGEQPETNPTTQDEQVDIGDDDA